MGGVQLFALLPDKGGILFPKRVSPLLLPFAGGAGGLQRRWRCMS